MKMSLTFDPAAAVSVLRRKDKLLAKLIRDAGPFTMQPKRMVSPFAALLQAIVHQQLSGKAAKTIYDRVAALLPQPKRPMPEALLRLPEKSLRGAGLSHNKYLAMRDLAEKSLDGTVPTLAKLRRMSDAEIVERLTVVRGIGVWTVEMLLMFRLGRPDVLPTADLGVRHGFKLTYGLAEMPHADRLTEHAERWRPFRSVASWYMWRAVDLHKAKTAAKVR